MSLFKREKRVKQDLSSIIPATLLPTAGVWRGLTDNNNVVIFCTQLISNVISSLPLILYITDTDGNKKVAGWHGLYKIVKYRPNYNEPSVTFYSLLIQDLIKYGNAYIYKIYNKNKISQIIRLDPQTIKIVLNGLEKTFIVGGQTYNNEQIIHIPAALGYNGVQGKGVLEFAREAIITSNEMQAFLRFVFSNGIISKMKINLNESDYKDLDTNKVKEILDLFAYLFSGENTGKPIVEYKGIKLDSFKIENNTDELYKNREFMDKQICNYFNVPYQLLSGENKYNSFEQFNQFFMTTCLNQYTDRISSYFTNFLLPPNEQGTYFFEFDFGELLTTDIDKLSNMLISQTKNGIISINEARQKLNYNSLPTDAANTNFIMGVGLVRDDVFNSWGAGSKLKQQILDEGNNK